MKLNPLATIIIGFIAGLAISGVLGDIIVGINNSAGRISSAWTVSRADKFAAGGNFSQAITEYEKALKKIKPKNKKLIAKVKNNLALSIFNISEPAKYQAGVEEALLIFAESLELYKEINDVEGINQVETNIKEAGKVLQEILSP
ncbi:MAG: hypothetical protein FWF00_05630 [Endomicrobia bacterium]|nr:hypothetical protein [Endomicrobiia bacterium]MCL2507149.1 hypothetical protein [Endomicrobiia bacterium]